MRLLNLFDGIGGFALAAEWMGWENVGSVEIDPFCRQVLDYQFDYECTWTDIKAADFVQLHRRIDIITGGFPCQPFSNAGKQRGKDDDRYLWPEMLRAIREVQPRWVVGENVRGLLTNAGGMVFEQVCADMEAFGYEVQPLLVPACAVDAPHRRDRVWIVARLAADTDSHRFGKREGEQKPFARSRGETHDSDGGKDGPITHPDRDGGQAQAEQPKRAGAVSDGMQRDASIPGCQSGKGRFGIPPGWSCFPTQSPVCGGDDGVALGLAGIPFPKWRREALKCFGNSIVPQVALEIFKAIEKTENELNNH